ncbi:MAG: TauD/TfdA family dioxygenase [Gammaproteobacteria bacterium]|nr:TauD/TfdA family dioxygenase [Gammaproteobacteria bacterium]
MAEQSAMYEIVNASIEDSQLTITWGDGHHSSYHPLWLRHQCECNVCGTPIDAVRGIRLLDIPPNIEPELRDSSNIDVHIQWMPDKHRSVYSAKWLRNHCYSDQERARRKHRPTLWDGSIVDALPTFDFNQVEMDQTEHLAMLESVRDYGFCRVINLSTEPGQSHRLIELIGTQRQTHFSTYNLSRKSSVDNVGDITSKLLPHVDETYRLSCIGITIFQVLQPSSNGGDSTLVDGFQAAHRMRKQWPEDFDLLTRVPIAAERLDLGANTDGQSRWYKARMPIIKLDSDNDISGVRINERQIAPLDIPADLIEPCYRALRRMFEILYDPKLIITLKLKAGDGLLFNNQRILHGRTEFDAEEPARSVLTSSVDLDDFHSTMRILRRTLDIEDSSMAFNQGMVV